VKERFIVVGLLQPLGGFTNIEHAAFLHIDELSTLLEDRDALSSLHVYLRPGASPDPVAVGLQKALGETLRVQAWRQAAAGIVPLIESSRHVNRISQAMVILAILLPTLALLWINVIREQRQIAALQAIGFTRRALFLVYLLRASFLGALGSLLGLATGLLLCSYFRDHPIYHQSGFTIVPLLRTSGVFESDDDDAGTVDMLYEVQALSRHFHRAGSALCALDQVSLQIPAGQLVAIVGPSGCGKTTLLHILGAIDPEFEGQVQLEGQALGKLSAGAAAALRLTKMGFVFQTFQLLDALTVQQNIALPLWRLRGSRKLAEATAARLAEELGISHRLSQRPQQLSVGEMQRAAVARALVCEPLVVLADEPTASLDAENGQHIIAALQAIAQQGRTVVVASHDTAVIRSASRVVRLERGRVVQDSTAPTPEGEVGGKLTGAIGR
jgi:putative ABC transport system ATP-binding protein